MSRDATTVREMAEPWRCYSCEREQPAGSVALVYGNVYTCGGCEAEATATIDATLAAAIAAAVKR